VASFLEGRLGFTSIPTVIERTLNEHQGQTVLTLELIRQVDAWARARAATLAASPEGGQLGTV